MDFKSFAVSLCCTGARCELVVRLNTSEAGMQKSYADSLILKLCL